MRGEGAQGPVGSALFTTERRGSARWRLQAGPAQKGFLTCAQPTGLGYPLQGFQSSVEGTTWVLFRATDDVI